MLFEIFSAFFGAGGLAPIKAKKAKIAGRARRQAIWVRLSSAYSLFTKVECGQNAAVLRSFYHSNAFLCIAALDKAQILCFNSSCKHNIRFRHHRVMDQKRTGLFRRYGVETRYKEEPRAFYCY